MDQLPVIRARLGRAGAVASPPAPAAPPRPGEKRVRVAPARAQVTAEEPGNIIRLKAPITVPDFATALDVEAEVVVEAAAGMGEVISDQDVVAPELATLIGEQWGYAVEVEPAPMVTEPEPEPEPEPVAVAVPAAAPVVPPVGVEPIAAVVPQRVVPRRVSPPDAPLRPPVVTVMGHVDHGKTTLLDAIRETNVTAQEAGQITQHIGAYQVQVRGRTITFIDTPGHEAFTAMRARGAQVTDIAILVVAADDGVMPQTIEAADHAKAAGVPVIVAVNKMDRMDAAADAIMQQLSEQGLVPEAWGGETIYLPISALQRTGIDDLLEMVLIVTDMHETRAVADKPAEGAVLEAELDKRRGPVATLLVQEGTLRTGDAVAAGPVSGKIRAMMNDRRERINQAGPATPVQVIGLSEVPEASEIFRVVANEREARTIAERTRTARREAELAAVGPRSLGEISRLFAAGEMKVLNLILKADVQGSVEAIAAGLGQLRHEEVRFELLHSGVGDVNESDVSLAAASKPTMIIGFQVGVDTPAKRQAVDEGVQIRRYDVIYDLLDEVRLLMTGLLETIFEEYVSGRAEVRALFSSSRVGTIAGCYVLEGHVVRGARARVMRQGQVAHAGVLTGLRHLKEDVSEMGQGFECGLSMQSFNGFEIGDVIECLEQREVRRAGV
jgi:translation initiation factor IF-2